MDKLRTFRTEGNQIVDTVNDLIFQSKITQSEIAYQTGKSEGQISCILHPLHQAQFSIADLPALMRLLDGKAILKVISGWLNMTPAPIPEGRLNHNHVMGTAGQLLSTVSDAIRDGELTMQEIHQIKSTLCDLVGSINTLLSGKQVGGL